MLFRYAPLFALLFLLAACSQAPSPTLIIPSTPAAFSDSTLDSAPLAEQAVIETLELQELEAFDLLSETDAPEADLDSSSLSVATGYLAYIQHLPADPNPWRVMLTDLTAQQTHTLYSGTQEVQSVAVTADGTVLIARQITAGSFQVFRLNPDGSAQRLTQGTNNRSNVSVSANGNTIAWEGVTAAGRRGFFLRRSGMSNDTFFGIAAGAQREPSLSSNGHYLTFVRDTATEQIIMLYDLRRSRYQPIFRIANAQLSYPSISDNLRVAYLQQQDGETLLRVIDIQSRSTVNVVRGTNVLEHPTLTADGAFVGYGLQNATQSHLILREVGSNSGTRTVTLTLPNRTLGMVWQKAVPNQNPIATDDSFTTAEDTVLQDNVILNTNPNGADFDPNGDPLTVVAADGSSDNIGTPFMTAKGAIVTLQSDGSLEYDPNGSFDSLNDGETDTDSFTYTLSDGEGGSATATVTITITGIGTDIPPPANTVWFVKAAATGAQDGTSWDNAFSSLQAALTAAQNSTIKEIWVAAGVYYPTSDPSNRSASFILTEGVMLYGGFEGTETTLEGRNIGSNLSILSGDIDQNDTDSNGVVLDANSIVGNNSYRLLWAQNVTSATVLDGFVITGGRANGGTGQNHGGGLYCEGSGSGNFCHPTLRNLSFMGNYGFFGGGLYNHANSGGRSSPSLTNIVFSGNHSDEGSALFNYAGNGISSPTLVNVTFGGNSTRIHGTIRNVSFSGGQSRPVMTNTIIWGNSGGEISNFNGVPTVTYSIVEGGHSGTGNLNSNPLFVNAAGGNLRLQAGSPAINTGLDSAIPTGVTTDLDGNSRFVGTVDMGAYEFQ